MFGPDKSQCRSAASEAVAGLSPALRSRLDHEICLGIAGFRPYTDARQVFAYWALADEVSLERLAKRACKEGKSLLLPLLVGESLEFRSWKPGETLVRGGHGVSEPRRGRPAEDLPSVVLVPGRAFDASGGRVGRGMGCYDRALDRLADYGPVVGVAYACQVFPSVPHGERDRAVGFLATEDGVVRAAGVGEGMKAR